MSRTTRVSILLAVVPNVSRYYLVLDFNPTANPDVSVFACLVGKVVTFENSGYSLKQSAYMDSMKADMDEAATITGVVAIVEARGLKQRVKLYLYCADNVVSGNAFKLGDIICYRNNKTVAVMNTDAQGRLVLADRLIDALQTELAVDHRLYTLTSAAKSTLLNNYHTLLNFDKALAQKFLISAATEQEPFWRLPLVEFHRR